MTKLAEYKEVVKLYDADVDVSAEAKEWKYWFDGFKDPIGNVQRWLMVGVSVAEYAAYLAGAEITPEEVSEFQSWLDNAIDDIHFTDYTPAAVKRAIFEWQEGGFIGSVMEKLAGGYYFA